MARTKQRIPLGYRRKPPDPPDQKCLQINKLSEEYNRNQIDIARMNAYIEPNSLDLDNLPSQDRIKVQGLLDSRRELTGKILDLFPCQNAMIISTFLQASGKQQKGYVSTPLPKKKNVKTENFTFRSPSKKAKTTQVADPLNISTKNKFYLLMDLDDQDQTATPPTTNCHTTSTD
ncbi:hypothetical protein NPIL_397651 [Nephila pilipes]|uniref:Uncharacterized protein n=1 Tax=Nephila pilipes TaxID=299642 RepID=A0A8X6T355_NEPPI|nr:hypothetical protein NPIL_397651 [Nephila pilipes]